LDAPDDTVGLVVVVPFDALTLEGVLADTLEAEVLDGVLLTVAFPLVCALETEEADVVLPTLLDEATPPLVETRLVNTLSDPVLCLDPCQLSSFM
jgi:hypothetical protein